MHTENIINTGSHTPSILHFADLHILDDSSVLKHLEKAAGYIVSACREKKPSLIVIAGDYFDRNLQFDSNAARFAVDLLGKLSTFAPVLMLEGTETHDRKSLETLAGMHLPGSVTIVVEPSIVSFPDIEGLEDVDFYCMPGIKKKNYKAVAEEYGLDMLRSQPGELVAYQFQKWSEMKLSRAGREAIFVGHIQLGVEGLEKMETGYEPVISPATIELIKPSLGLLGHVHDTISHGKYHYSGNIVARSMTEAEIVTVQDGGEIRIDRKNPGKGYYIHTRTPEGPWKSAFHKIDTVRYSKIHINARDEAELVLKMGKAQEYLQAAGKDCGEDGIVCKFDVETPDPAVSEVVFRHENVMRETMGDKAEIVPPSINVTSFSEYAARVKDADEWYGKDPLTKFHEWRHRRGFESNSAEDIELNEKISQVL